MCKPWPTGVHGLSTAVTVLPLFAQVMSQDLIRATMEIPFSVPPYSALLGRSVASLEGIALQGDPNYQARPLPHTDSYIYTGLEGAC